MLDKNVKVEQGKITLLLKGIYLLEE